MKIFFDTKAFLERLLLKPAPLRRKDGLISKSFMRSLQKSIDLGDENDRMQYCCFLDRLCRVLSLTSVNNKRRLEIDIRGRKFIFLEPSRGFEVLFFGWLYYFPWHHLFPYGRLGVDLEEKGDEIMDFIKELPAEEYSKVDEILSELVQNLAITWQTTRKGNDNKEREGLYSEKVIEEKTLCWGIRHMVLKPLSWFEFLSFHDSDGKETDLSEAEHILVKPTFKVFLSEKNPLVL